MVNINSQDSQALACCCSPAEVIQYILSTLCYSGFSHLKKINKRTAGMFPEVVPEHSLAERQGMMQQKQAAGMSEGAAGIRICQFVHEIPIRKTAPFAGWP